MTSRIVTFLIMSSWTFPTSNCHITSVHGTRSTQRYGSYIRYTPINVIISHVISITHNLISSLPHSMYQSPSMNLHATKSAALPSAVHLFLLGQRQFINSKGSKLDSTNPIISTVSSLTLAMSNGSRSVLAHFILPLAERRLWGTQASLSTTRGTLQFTGEALTFLKQEF